MKNLVPYKEENCYPVHIDAVARKEEKDLRDRLNKLDKIILTDYDNFNAHFNANSLEKVSPNGGLTAHSEDLTSLYGYKTKVIRSVRKTIRDLQIQTIIATCQNCTIAPVNSMDHVLPQSKFPEFIVNPRNLFPSCTICNGHKLASVSTSSQKLFLNLYLDELPESQYLFVDIVIDKNNEIDFSFVLRNVNKVDTQLFTTLDNHYTRLHLYERMKTKSVEGLSEFRNRLVAYSRRMPATSIIQTELEKIEEDKKCYGHNHWKCILEESLLNSASFIKTVFP